MLSALLPRLVVTSDVPLVGLGSAADLRIDPALRPLCPRKRASLIKLSVFWSLYEQSSLQEWRKPWPTPARLVTYLCG